MADNLCGRMLTVSSGRSEKQGDAGVNYATQKNLLRQVRFPLIDYDVTLEDLNGPLNFLKQIT